MCVCVSESVCACACLRVCVCVCVCVPESRPDKHLKGCGTQGLSQDKSEAGTASERKREWLRRLTLENKQTNTEWRKREAGKKKRREKKRENGGEGEQ